MLLEIALQQSTVPNHASDVIDLAPGAEMCKGIAQGCKETTKDTQSGEVTW